MTKNNALQLTVIFFFGLFIFTRFLSPHTSKISENAATGPSLESLVLPADGVILPIKWDNLGKQMIETGVIDEKNLSALYAERGGVPEEMKQALSSNAPEEIKITKANSGVWLNLLWGFGLSNKNGILEKGPMTDKQNGEDPSRFASTGGWPLASGKVMDHYSKHIFISITPEQQAMVERVSKGIFRPCCGNSVYFPDCNHGMAMLGLLELMAANNVSESDLYKIALRVNSFWFPDTYLTIAEYFQKRGVN